MGRLIGCVAAVALLVAFPLHAQELQQVVLPVTINTVAQGETAAAIEGDDVLVPRQFMEGHGIPAGKAPTRQVGGELYVSLKALAPSVKFVFDVEQLTLNLTVDPHLLGNRQLELHRGLQAVADRGGDPTLFLNYALFGAMRGAPALFTEIGAGRGNSLFYSGLTRSAGRFSRGQTYALFDSPSRMTRWTIGDSIVGNDPLGGIVPIGGVTYSRQFSLQPYFVRYNQVDATGTATTPATVEVYVNGQLTNRISVEPGVFTLRDLPVTGGLGDTRLVIRDVFGRETVQESSFYYSTAALQKGLSDFVFSAGKIRNEGGTGSYGDAAAIGDYRLGVTNWLTLGGRAEASRHVLDGGPRVTVASGIGDFDVSLAASRSGDQRGSAGSLQYRFLTTRYSFGGALTRRSGRYATLSMLPDVDRVTRDASVYAATYFGRFSIGISAGLTNTRDGQQSRRIALQGTTSIGRWASVFTSVGTSEQNGRRQPEVIAGLTVNLGGMTSANAMFQKANDTKGLRTEIRRPLTLANGFGFGVQNDTATNSRTAQLQYQSSYGRYETQLDPDHVRESTFDVSGGLVYLGGTLAPTRPLQESYALARVGVPGVEIFSSNQEVGRTNRSGDLLITNLLPHYGNELSLDDKDLPIDYVVDSTKTVVVPPSRGGVIANFAIRKIRSYSGRMVFMIVGEPYVPSLGILHLERSGGGAVDLPLGRGGEFYTEDLGPGTYDATLRIGKVSCNSKLVLPDSKESMTNLGDIKCAP